MITEKIDQNEEFINPNINYSVLMSKLKTRITNLEEDFSVIQDPILKGMALNEIISLRKTYFDYLKVDLELQHLVLSNPDIYNNGDKDESI